MCVCFKVVPTFTKKEKSKTVLPTSRFDVPSPVRPLPVPRLQVRLGVVYLRKEVRRGLGSEELSQ